MAAAGRVFFQNSPAPPAANRMKTAQPAWGRWAARPGYAQHQFGEETSHRQQGPESGQSPQPAGDGGGGHQRGGQHIGQRGPQGDGADGQ